MMNYENIDDEENEDRYDFDKEDELEDDLDQQPFDPEKIKIDTKTITIEGIMRLLNDRDEEGNPKEIELILQPEFQRNKVWNEVKRKSLFIESLMLKIPIPAFYFYEDDGKFYVIDGLQRLSTIYDFIKNKFKLIGLQYLGKKKNDEKLDFCNNKFFKELEQIYKSRIYQTNLSINIIDPRTPARVKYDIFRRINTGGKSLNYQEIRNSIAKKELREILNELVQSEEYGKIINKKNDLSDNNFDIRMQHRELILRFIAFYDIYNFEERKIKLYDKETNQGYIKSVPNFLDNSFDYLNKLIPERSLIKKDKLAYTKSYNEAISILENYKKKFKKAMRLAYLIFGNYAFRKITQEDFEQKSKLKPLNKSLFASWSVMLSYVNLSEEEVIKRKKNVINNLIEKIEHYEYKNKDDETALKYIDSIQSGTNNRINVELNFIVTRQIFDEELKNDN